MLETVKSYLRITWNDEDAALSSMIERGQAHLNDLSGVQLNFDVEGPARSLLLDYCRYVYNNASEYFEENYRKEILRLQLKAGVEAMLAEEAVPDEG